MPSARFVSFDNVSKTEGDILLNALKKDGGDFIEVVFHLITVTDCPYFENISTEWVKEYEFVSSKTVYDKYISKWFVFVNYEDIS